MESVLRFWAVTRDGRGKWVVKYDPRYELKEEGDTKRFAFETHAREYEKAMIKRDKAAQERLAQKQIALLGEVQGE